MPAGLTPPLKLFYCYAREDKLFREELDKHLAELKRQHQIASWSDREILPGTNWEKEIDTQINTAHIILLLISPDFMNSHYCYGIEMKRALERHETGIVRVIPILIRWVYWEGAPFSTLQMLPTDARPVTKWADSDEAFCDITRGILKAIQDLRISLQSKETWFEMGEVLYQQKKFEDALVAFDEAIRLAPTDAASWDNKGTVLRDLQRYEDAFAAYDEAIRLAPTDDAFWKKKGAMLYILQRYEDALAAYDEAICLAPTDADSWHNKGAMLHNLQRYNEALIALDEAIRLAPTDADPWHGKANVLAKLQYYEGALAAFDEAIRLAPTDADPLE